MKIKHLLIGLGWLLSQTLIVGIACAINSGNWYDIISTFQALCSGLPYIIAGTMITFVLVALWYKVLGGEVLIEKLFKK